jgi:NADPH:quinone reductase-like Zn-dependent oxidoreductase
MIEQKVAVFDNVGDRQDFCVRRAPMPQPGQDEVRLKISAFGLNQADILLTQGRHYVKANLPIRLGYEGCGIVDAVGADVTRFKVGDAVACIPNVDGPYFTGGEFALAREAFVAEWPAGFSAEEAAALWMQYLTAYFPVVELFPVQKGDWVLITAASGGTGMGTIAMAKLFGARVIATTRTPDKHAMLKAQGADHVLSTEGETFVDDVMKITNGKGAQLVIDTLCGPYVARLAKILASRGRLVVHGGLAGSNDFTMDILDLVHRGAGLYGYSLINELRVPGAIDRARDFISEAIASGRLPKPRVDSSFPFEHVDQAYRRMREGKQTGKIVVRLNP